MKVLAVQPHFTYPVAEHMDLYLPLAECVRSDASDLHIAQRTADGVGQFRLRVDGYLDDDDLALKKSLTSMMEQVFNVTPLELSTPQDQFLHALGAKPLRESEDLRFHLQTVVDGHTRRWRAAYAPPRQNYVGVALVARLLPVTSSSRDG